MNEEIRNEEQEIKTDDIQIKLDNLERENRELKSQNHSLTSQLGHTKKIYNDLKTQGMTEEEKNKQELERLQSELTQAQKTIKINALESKKQEYIKKYSISDTFVDFIVLNEEMTENDLENLIKGISEKEKAFETKILNDYSITTTGITGSNVKKEKDLVDIILEKKEKISTNLLD